MDSWEWSLWKSLMGIDPFGDDRSDWHAAQLQATIANFAGKVSGRRVEVRDCLLDFRAPEPPSTVTLENKIREGFARMMGMQNIRKKPSEK